MLKRYQGHVQTFLEAPLPHFNVKPLMSNDCLCNKFESSALREGVRGGGGEVGGGGKGNKFVIFCPWLYPFKVQ